MLASQELVLQSIFKHIWMWMWELLVKESKWKCAMALTRLSAAQARVLCLHYYSNALTFNFTEDPNEVTVTYHRNLYDSMLFWFCFKEVYREDKIKEWDPVDPSELEHFLQIILIPCKTLPWWHLKNQFLKSKIRVLFPYDKDRYIMHCWYFVPVCHRLDNKLNSTPPIAK